MRNLARVMSWAGKFEEAALSAQQAIDYLGEDLESRFLAATCYRLAGHVDLAIEHYRALVELDGAFWQARLPLGEMLAELGKYKEAKLHLSRGLEDNPDDVPAHRELGIVLLHLEEWKQSVQHLQKAHEADPKDSRTTFYLGRAHKKQGNARDALKWLKETTRIDKQHAAARNELGLLLMEQSRLDEAIQCFQAALKIDPDFEEAAINLEIARDKFVEAETR